MVGEPSAGSDKFLPVKYNEDDFAKMEVKMVPGSIKGEEYLRYATITEANQIVLEILDSNEGLKHKIVFLDELRLESGTNTF